MVESIWSASATLRIHTVPYPYTCFCSSYTYQLFSPEGMVRRSFGAKTAELSKSLGTAPYSGTPPPS